MHVIATAGHVDHGKSTLIRALTGMEPDRWAEEHRRGMTIDLGFAWGALPGGDTAAFVDVPGHERFVPNMLAGIGPVPAAMFVVAADEGWMAQSAEHLEALNALGVQHGLLVVTRCDIADPHGATEQALEQLGATSLGRVPVVHASGTTGWGIAELRQELDDLTRRLPPPDHDEDVRLWIDRTFSVHGAGTVVTGTLAGGRLRVGQQVSLHPAGRTATIRGLHSLGTPQRDVGAVARVAVNLRGVSLQDVARGGALLAPRRWLTTEVVDVRLRGSVAAQLPRELMFHVGSESVAARVRPLGAHTARLTLRRPQPLRIGDRALLRDTGGRRIPAGVVVLDVRPPELTRRGAARRRATSLLDYGDQPDGVAELRRRRLVRIEELRAMGAHPPPDAIAGTDWLLDSSYRDELAARLPDVLAQHHREQPLSAGMPVESVRHALDLPETALLAPVLRAPGAADLTLHEGRLSATSTTLPESVRHAVTTLRKALRTAPFQAPTSEELAALGMGEQELAAAERAGELSRLGPGLVLLPAFETAAVERLRHLPDRFTPAQARQALGTSRRVVVPLLEHLARHGYTERLPEGAHRVV
ncbi:selenocysteine-specific translation elongation factor [Parasphingorhabdus pacifica]